MHAGTVVTVCRQLYTTFVKVYSRDRVCFRIVFFSVKGSDVPSGSYCENESKMKMCSECIFHGGLECRSFHPYAGKKGRENVGCVSCFLVGWYMDISNSSICFRVFVALAVSPFSPLAYLCA